MSRTCAGLPIAAVRVLLPLTANLACTGIVGGQPTPDSDVGRVRSDLPCDVAAVLDARCISCHGSPPPPGVPVALTSYADLSAPAPSDPSQSTAAVAAQRMKDANFPMPPGLPPTSDEVAVLEGWIAAGLPAGDCGASNPYDTPARCSSERYWAGGAEESPDTFGFAPRATSFWSRKVKTEQRSRCPTPPSSVTTAVGAPWQRHRPTATATLAMIKKEPTARPDA